MDTLLPVDAETPRSLVLDPPLTDAQFQELCFANDWFRFERTREGEILMHPPSGGFTSVGNAEISCTAPVPGGRPTFGVQRTIRTEDSSFLTARC